MTTQPAVTCAYGIAWRHHFEPPIGTGRGCLLCAAQAAQLSEEFERAVARGDYDRDGYTPADRQRGRDR